MESILTAYSNNQDEDKACEELSQKLHGKDAKLNFLFCSRSYDPAKMSAAFNKHFNASTIGSTTAGEISPEGFSDDSIVGISFHGDEFESDLISIPDLNDENEEAIIDLKKQFHAIQARHEKSLKTGKTFAVLLIDGLSVQEEEYVSIIDDILKGVPLIGGSASDKLEFKSTLVYSNGVLQENTATLAIITTTIPFEIFKVQHFMETDKRFVITNADPKTRTVHEIEGYPAGQFYADLLGVQLSDLSPTVFSKNPVMLKMGDDYYVRSIQKMNPDLSLTFYCAIDSGLVLRLGSLKSLHETTSDFFMDLANNLGGFKTCIFFECILRRLEIMEMSQEERDRITELYRKNNALGFHTFGEQFGGVHVNQTLTGVAFGKRRV
ncbi:FIST signal transduction protein [Peredibacter starrii]|uniref:FIST N-terminal domain-containing protein n=1 Tax=Peredibacter starrii TaxID=28202 RepID=A0AAX4HTI8_9BACT|nr:FIST N-terminal domain-containing protein [Peredibacter starrii]WPU66679.1 FIST N-terminal domain-containing protein [Peredibacter starrii]